MTTYNSKTPKTPYSNTVSNYTGNRTSAPLSIDWLSVSCKRISEPKQPYKFQEQQYGTKIFKKVEKITLNEMPIGWLTSVPASNILPADSAILKFENWLLYQDFFQSNILNYISDFGLTYNGINRLDIAVDINTFANNLKPNNLIQRFLKEEYKHLGRSKFKVIGSTNVKNSYDYIRFGTGESAISVYLYNKTKELAEVADKQHIREIWKKSELDITNDIWRLEASFRGDKKNLTDIDTGEIHDIDLHCVMNDNELRALYFTAIKERFTFLRSAKDSNKSRLQRVVLFEDIKHIHHKTIYKDYKPDTTRTHKVAIKKYIDFYNEIRYTMPSISYTTLKQIEQYANQYRLTNYLYEKTEYEILRKEMDQKKEEMEFKLAL